MSQNKMLTFDPQNMVPKDDVSGINEPASRS